MPRLHHRWGLEVFEWAGPIVVERSTEELLRCGYQIIVRLPAEFSQGLKNSLGSFCRNHLEGKM